MVEYILHTLERPGPQDARSSHGRTEEEDGAWERETAVLGNMLARCLFGRAWSCLRRDWGECECRVPNEWACRGNKEGDDEDATKREVRPKGRAD